MKQALTDASVKKIKKERNGKSSISGSTYQRDVKEVYNVLHSIPKSASERKRKSVQSEACNKKFKKESHGNPSISGSTYQRDVKEVCNVLHSLPKSASERKKKRVQSEAFNKKFIKVIKEKHEKLSVVDSRCPALVKFGEFEIKTSYSCQFPQEENATRLIFCEFCLQYSKSQSVLDRHNRHCCWRTPPGTEIYKSGDISIFEVDGKVDKTYCETLCKVGKLFWDLNILNNDVEQFLFYIVTKNDGFGCHLAGFSKLKKNKNNYNIACIVTIPQYRRQGYGRILVEISDLVSKTERKPGKLVNGWLYLHSVTENVNNVKAPYFKKEPHGKPSISGSMYKCDVKEDCSGPLLLPLAASERKRVQSEATSKQFKKEIKKPHGKPSISGSMYKRDVKEECNFPLSLPLAVSERKRKRVQSEARNKKFKKEIKEKHENLSVAGSTNQRDVKEVVLKNKNRPVVSDLPSGVENEAKNGEGTKILTTNRKIQSLEKCPALIKFGDTIVETNYSCQFPQEENATRLIFCEFCLQYSKCQSVLDRHNRHCCWRTPPGTEIYKSGDISIFEVDGKVDKTYCETLCRVGKLFLNLKVLDYGVEPFLFYIVTKNDGFGCHLAGYFSKVKNNEENHNLACLVIMPQYRRQGYGRTLIELSYLISKTDRQPGTPEKPFSSLGKLTYEAYWKTVILEYLDKHRRVNNICVDDICSKTGLMAQDILHTLESLNMIVEIYNKITICVDWSIVDTHIKKGKVSKKVRIDPDRLTWTPTNKSSNLVCSSDRKEDPFFIKCI